MVLLAIFMTLFLIPQFIGLFTVNSVTPVFTLLHFNHIFIKGEKIIVFIPHRILKLHWLHYLHIKVNVKSIIQYISILMPYWGILKLILNKTKLPFWNFQFPI